MHDFKWDKKVDSSKEGQNSPQEIIFSNISEQPIISKIIISRTGDYTFIKISGRDDLQTERLRSIFKPHFKYSAFSDGDPAYVKTLDIIVRTVEQRRLAIKLIHQVDPSDALEAELEIIFEIQDFLTFAKKGKFSDAFVQAKMNDRNHDCLWQLAKFYHEKGNLEEAKKVYQAIGEENPHYCDANGEIVNIIYDELNNIYHEAKEEGRLIDREEILLIKENQLHFAMKAGSNWQTHVDRIFDELAGGDDFTPITQNMKGDVETLILLARRLREAAEQKHILQAKVKELEIKLEKSQEKNDEVLSTLDNKAGAMVVNSSSNFFLQIPEVTGQSKHETSAQSNGKENESTASKENIDGCERNQGTIFPGSTQGV
jgi:tetratricopeptide (TPR) repeat protein